MAENEGVVQKKSKLMPIIIGVVLLVVVAGAAAFLVPKFLNKGAAEGEDASVEEVTSDEPGEYYEMREFVVNLSEVTRYLKTRIVLEVDSAKAVDEIEAKNPRIRDDVLILLSSKSTTELSDLAGKNQLKDQLTFRINRVLKKGRVMNIYFKQFVIQ